MSVSDTARERAVTLLRQRCEEGYLSLDTFERRIEDVYRADTAAQLAALTADLPAVGPVAPAGQERRTAPAADGSPNALRLPLDLVGDQVLILGRSSRCDVVVEHDTVSRRHAALTRAGGGWLVADLGSTNGTWLDGRRVDEPIGVRRGDQLRLGDCAVLLL